MQSNRRSIIIIVILLQRREQLLFEERSDFVVARESRQNVIERRRNIDVTESLVAEEVRIVNILIWMLL